MSEIVSSILDMSTKRGNHTGVVLGELSSDITKRSPEGVIGMLSISDQSGSEGLELLVKSGRGIVELLDEVSLSVGLVHLFGPGESVGDPSIDLFEVDIADSFSSSNSGGSEVSHSLLSGSIVSSHFSFNSSDEGSLSVKKSVSS
jgi:hypothetical protein